MSLCVLRSHHCIHCDWAHSFSTMALSPVKLSGSGAFCFHALVIMTGRVCGNCARLQIKDTFTVRMSTC